MPSTELKCGKATKFNAHSLPQIPQCHLASSFNVTDEPPIAVSKLLNLAVHWPSKVWPVGMIARKRRECLKFNTPLDVSFQKSTKVFPYYSISVMNSTFLSVSSMNTLLAILKVTDARREVILASGQNHPFPWRHLPPPGIQRIFRLPSRKLILWWPTKAGIMKRKRSS